VTLLERINGPEDLKELTQEQLGLLAAEIRDVLVETVTRTSGHLGPNLGVVELTIALHRVFDSPRDKLIFDTGHQSYVHKLLTGRYPDFHTLRQAGGLSGYPSRAESAHDLVENSHASTSLSYADGMAKAYKLRGEHDRTVVAVIGDGALTGGMAWEALNNIAVARDSRLVIVVNDNGRSYQPTIGGLASHLATMRVSQRYEHVLDYIKTTVTRTPLVGHPLYGALHGAKKGLKDFLQPQVLFEDLGIKYVGPIDGHDEQMTEHALRRAAEYGGPVLVHVITRKGFGYPLAEQNEEDCLHQVPAAPPKSAAPAAPAAQGAPAAAAVKPGAPAAPGAPPAPKRTWTDVFADEMVAIGARRPDVVAITAAMLHPTGLAAFKAAYPDRVYDVGIAEQHAMTSAAGLAMGGLHPVVAVYATFLNRAFDQLLMDVALHRLPVTVALDRAGVTGPDGASHNGMWDGSILQVVPGLRVAAPRDGSRIAELLGEAIRISDGPTVIRYPKGTVGAEADAVGRLGTMDVLAVPADGAARDVLLLGVGPMAVTCVEVGKRLADHGIGVTVVDPRWVKPVDEAVIAAARQHRLVAVVEDNGRAGGFGDAVSRLLHDNDLDTPVRTFGLPQEFLTHGSREEILDATGLTPQHLARQITEAVARRTPAADASAVAEGAPEQRLPE
jgi:1-deoxy-D-xylulose-5-phosphate synthase